MLSIDKGKFVTFVGTNQAIYYNSGSFFLEDEGMGHLILVEDESQHVSCLKDQPLQQSIMPALDLFKYDYKKSRFFLLALVALREI